MTLKTSLTWACFMGLGLGLGACAVGTTGTAADGSGGGGANTSTGSTGTETSAGNGGIGTSGGQTTTGGQTTSGGQTTTGGQTGGGPTGGFDPNGGTGNSTGGGAQDCDNDTKQIYVIAKDGSLHMFEPKKLIENTGAPFTRMGSISCPSGSTPNSMAVDRNGTAWVDFKDGTIFKVDTKTLTCTATSFSYPQNLGPKFGMGFSTDGAGSTGESLFAVNDGGIELFKIDTGSMGVSSVNRFSSPAMGGAVELTGTGAGQLFGLFFDPMSDGSLFTVGEIDKTNASILGGKKDAGIMDMPLSLAFAFWGGSAWIFTGTSDTSSQVYRYDPTTGGAAQTAISRVDFKIVGAGVSTCAPATEAEIANV